MHHRACWSDEGGCAALGCRELHHRETAPIGVGEGLERVDLDTPLERSLFALSIGLSLAALIIALMNARTEDVLTCFLLAALCGWLYRNTDCSYFIDRRRRRVLYLRDLAGWARRFEVCSFDDVALVAVSACQLRNLGAARRIGEGWAYWVALVLADGRCIAVTDPVPFDVEGVNTRARVLARALDVPLHEGRDECPLEVRIENGQPVMKPSERETQLHCLIPRIVTAGTTGLVILIVMLVAWSRRPGNLLMRHDWALHREERSLRVVGDGDALAWDFRSAMSLTVEIDAVEARPTMWKGQAVLCSVLGRSSELGAGAPHYFFLVPGNQESLDRLRALVADPPGAGRRLHITAQESRPRPLGKTIPLRFTSWASSSGKRCPSSFLVVEKIDLDEDRTILPASAQPLRQSVAPASP